MTAPLEGIKVVDWTQVQSGPSCTQMLAWLGAEVIKVERPGVGDATRHQMRDIPNEDALYYLTLNSNKKSLELNIKTDEGKKILTELIKQADIFVENEHPGAAAKEGFGWEDVHKINPRCIMGSIKGFNPKSRFENVKAYEPVAQCAGGAAATTGWYEGEFNIPTQSGAALGDSNSGMHLLIGLLSALLLREKTGEGSYVYQSMQNAVMNLCRIKLRDQQALDRLGSLDWYACYNTPGFEWGDTLPRPENSEGGAVLGWCYRCKNYQSDPNDFVYIVVQREEKPYTNFCNTIGRPDMLTDPRFATAEDRDKNKHAFYAEVEKFTIQHDKYELTTMLGDAGIPIGPVLSWKELETDEELLADGTITKVDQGGVRGSYLTIGLPFFISDFKPDIKRAPGLGENNVEVLTSLGYSEEQIEKLKADGVI